MILIQMKMFGSCPCNLNVDKKKNPLGIKRLKQVENKHSIKKTNIFRDINRTFSSEKTVNI